MKKLLYIIIILFWASWAFGTTYYVKNGGSDSADGLSDGNAWATIAKINDFAEATGFASGDIIQLKRGSTWTSDETLGWDTAAINWGTINGLTIQDYGEGALPIIDGNSQHPIIIIGSNVTNLTLKNLNIIGMDATPISFYALVQIFYVEGVTVDGLTIDGHGGGASTYNFFANGALAINDGDPQSGNIEIKNCTIQNMYMGDFDTTRTTWDWHDNPGIFIYFNDYIDGKTSGTVSIHDNTVSSVYSDTIAVEGVRTTTNIYNNTLSNFGENAIDGKGSRYINVYNNDISHNNFGSSGGELYWGATVVVSTPNSITNNLATGDFTFYNNYVHDCALAGIRLGASLPVSIYNNYFEDVGNAVVITSSNFEFYNNLIVMTADAGSSNAMDLDAYRNAVSIRYNRTNKVYNNSIYISSTNHKYGIYLFSDVGSNTIIKNNIVQMTRDNSAVFPLFAVGTGATVSHNDWYGTHTNRVSWGGTVYDSTEQANWITEGHTGSLFTNPQLNNPGSGDFTLTIELTGTDLGDTYKYAIDPINTTWSPISVVTLDRDIVGWNMGATGWVSGVYNVSPADGETGVSVTKVATWNSPYATDDVWLTQATCESLSATQCDGTPDSDNDADNSFDMTTIINGATNTVFCLEFKANGGAEDCVEYEFTTTGGPPPVSTSFRSIKIK